MADAPKKGLYHSELCKLQQPVTVKVIKEEHESSKKKGSFYVTLLIDGMERYYNSENEKCGAAFKGQVGKTISICAEGRDEDAIITVVGAPASQLPPRQQAAAPERSSNPPGRPGGAPARPQAKNAVPPAEDHVDSVTNAKHFIARNRVLCVMALEAAHLKCFAFVTEST